MSLLTFQIHTFGCKVNTYDSGLLESRLEKSGFTRHSKLHPSSNIHILNTCAVTKEATKEAIKTARRLKIKNPNALIVVTGCAAQVDTEEIGRVPGVDLVVANSHKGDLEKLIHRYYTGELRERVHKSNIFKKEDLEPGGGIELGHTRSFLKIQDGCNSFCTFCVIPFARGKSRSLSISDLIQRVNELYRAGVREVVFTGVHIADYQDQDLGLEDLIETILAKTEMPRLRLSSLEPGEVSSRLLELYKDERMCPHFHMSIQSANSKVLREMKRHYTAEQVEESLKQIRSQVKNAYIGMDVIAGFPGESEEEFLDSVERLKRSPWTRLHVFPYSERPGTFAARRDDKLDQLSIKGRASLLRQLSEQRWQEEQRNQIGTWKKALVLSHGQLLTRDYWNVELKRENEVAELKPNDEVAVLIEAVGEEPNRLKAQSLKRLTQASLKDIPSHLTFV